MFLNPICIYVLYMRIYACAYIKIHTHVYTHTYLYIYETVITNYCHLF